MQIKSLDIIYKTKKRKILKGGEKSGKLGTLGPKGQNYDEFPCVFAF